MAQTRALSGLVNPKNWSFDREIVAGLLVGLSLALASCSGIPGSNPSSSTLAGSSGGGGTSNSIPNVSVAPDNAQIKSGGNQQFTAQVENTSETAVRWSASAGIISPTGLFSAPKVTSAQTVTIIATSVADKSVVAKATATVEPVAKTAALEIMTATLSAATSGVAYQTTLSASGGQSPYQWSLSSGSLPAGITLDGSNGVISGTPSQVGTSQFKVTVSDAAGDHTAEAFSMSVSTNPSAYDGPAELPRVYLQTTMADTPAPGRTIAVPAGGDLQSVLNNASCGDTITLQAGATYSGLFHFPAKSCDDQDWIIVRTSTPDSSLPAEGTRMTPCYAGVSSLPGRPEFNCSSTQNVLAKLVFNQPSGAGPVQFASGANHYRLIGLEITRATGTTSLVSNLIGPETNVAGDHIILDRLWVHGTAQDETTRGVYLSGLTSTAVIDSFFTDFHCIAITGSCTDSQAIAGGIGNLAGGPYKIFDNFLEAAAENVSFGGGDGTVTPADIEIRQNHLFKPLIWMQGRPGFVGGRNGNPFVVKNDFELKNAQRVLFDGNVVEYSWGGFTQTGYSLVLTPKNQAMGNTNTCPLCSVTDVTIRYSTVSHAAAGINIANVYSDNNGMAAAGGRYSIHDLTLDDINSSFYLGSGPLTLILNAWPINILGNISINHITGIGDATQPTLTVGNAVTNPQIAGFVYTNNLVIAGADPVWSSGGGKDNCAYSDIPVTVVKTCFNGYSFATNAFIAPGSNYPPSVWPKSNLFPSSVAEVGFTNFSNGNGGNYQLLPSSPYKNAGTDGKDLGADIETIQSEIANAY